MIWRWLLVASKKTGTMANNLTLYMYTHAWIQVLTKCASIDGMSSTLQWMLSRTLQETFQTFLVMSLYINFTPLEAIIHLQSGAVYTLIYTLQGEVFAWHVGHPYKCMWYTFVLTVYSKPVKHIMLLYIRLQSWTMIQSSQSKFTMDSLSALH